MKISLLFLVFIINFIKCDWYHRVKSVELDYKNYNNYLGGSKHVIVDFFTPWCPHCQDFAPDWNKLYEKYNGYNGIRKDDIVIAKMNCDESKNYQICNMLDVTGYPTIMHFEPYSMEGQKYKKHRTFQHLSQWIDQICYPIKPKQQPQKPIIQTYQQAQPQQNVYAYPKQQQSFNQNQQKMYVQPQKNTQQKQNIQQQQAQIQQKQNQQRLNTQNQNNFQNVVTKTHQKFMEMKNIEQDITKPSLQDQQIPKLIPESQQTNQQVAQQQINTETIDKTNQIQNNKIISVKKETQQQQDNVDEDEETQLEVTNSLPSDPGLNVIAYVFVGASIGFGFYVYQIIDQKNLKKFKEDTCV